MKKRNFYVSICLTIFTLFLFSCQNRQKGKIIQKEVRAVIKGNNVIDNANFTTNRFDNAELKQIDSFIAQQKVCAACSTGRCTTSEDGTASDCSNSQVYCVNSDCAKKILCCHQIDYPTFQLLTKNADSASFPLSQINIVLSVAVCSTQVIQINTEVDGGSTYYDVGNINATDMSSPPSTNWQVYYSVPLMQQLANMSPVYFTFYTGLDRNQEKIMPISLKISDTEFLYYDVSNDLP